MLWAAKPTQTMAVAGATHFKGNGRLGAMGAIPILAVVEKARAVEDVGWVGSIVDDVEVDDDKRSRWVVHKGRQERVGMWTALMMGTQAARWWMCDEVSVLLRACVCVPRDLIVCIEMQEQDDDLGSCRSRSGFNSLTRKRRSEIKFPAQEEGGREI
jgi:hypothetical protein